MPESKYATTRVDRGVLVITFTSPEVRGDDVAEGLRTVMLDSVKQHQAKKVVVDLSHVKMFTTVGFRPLLSLRRVLHDLDGRLLLCGLQPHVRETFETVRLISTAGQSAPFDAVADVDAAVDALAK